MAQAHLQPRDRANLPLIHCTCYKIRARRRQPSSSCPKYCACLEIHTSTVSRSDLLHLSWTTKTRGFPCACHENKPENAHGTTTIPGAIASRSTSPSQPLAPQLQCCRVRFGISGLQKKNSHSGRYMSGDQSATLSWGDTGDSRILFIPDLMAVF